MSSLAPTSTPCVGCVGDDHLEPGTQEGSHQRHLLLVASRQVLRGLLDRCSLEAQAGSTSAPTGARSAASVGRSRTFGVLAEHLQRRVGAHARGREDRLLLAVGAEQDDVPARIGPGGLVRFTRLPAQVTVPCEGSTPASARRNCTWPLPSAPAMPTISPRRSSRSTGPKRHPEQAVRLQHGLAVHHVGDGRERRLERPPDHHRDHVGLGQPGPRRTCPGSHRHAGR